MYLNPHNIIILKKHREKKIKNNTKETGNSEIRLKKIRYKNSFIDILNCI